MHNTYWDMLYLMACGVNRIIRLTYDKDRRRHAFTEVKVIKHK